MRFDKYDDLNNSTQYTYALSIVDVDDIRFAYSNRYLLPNYKSSLVRVRHAITGIETNVSPTVKKIIQDDSIVDVGGVLVDFLSAQKGYLPQWKDQTGNGRNAIQTTAASQIELKKVLNYYSLFCASSKTSLFVCDYLAGFVDGADKKFTLAIHFNSSLGNASSSNTLLWYYNSTPIINGLVVDLLYNSTVNKQEIRVIIGDGTNSVQLKTNAVIIPSTNTSIFVSYDGSVDTTPLDRFKIYVNGVEVGLILVSVFGVFPFDIGFTSVKPFFGLSTSFNSAYSINDYIFFSRILTPSEVSYIYKNQLSVFG